MSEGRFEETEILLKHSEFVLASLEFAAHQFREDGEIMKMLSSSDGSKIRSFAKNFVKAKKKGDSLPTLNQSLYQTREKIAMQMIMPIRTIDYTVYWCQLSVAQLKVMTETSREFDFRWNLPITLSSLKLFGAFCRIVLYLHHITAAKFLVQLFSSSSLPTTLPLQCQFDDLLDFVSKCQDEPFAFIASQLDFIKEKMSLMVVNLLPFFSTLMGDWTVFDWSMLSIYERSPESTIGDSMPINEYTYLANISFLQEVLTLFTLTFTSFMDENQQFIALGHAILSETGTFYLSRNFPVSIEELIKVSIPSKSLTGLKSNLQNSINRKNKEVHLYRMKQLLLLASDVVNFSELNFNSFLRSIHIVRAIAAFAYYEIDLFFRTSDKFAKSPDHIKTVSHLLHYIVELAYLFIKRKPDVERFFLYNLATVDADHLSYILNKFGTDLGTAGADVVATGRLILESLEDLDLAKFDNGIRYDFYPLQLTHGRALHRHNVTSQRLRVSFLTPLCEHLMTISMHASACQDPVNWFLECCQLHTMWRHLNKFDAFISNPSAPIVECTCFVHIFELFNYDKIVMSMHMNEGATAQSILENQIRQSFIKRMFSLMSNLLSSNSRIMQFSLDGPIGQVIPEQNLTRDLRSKEYCNREAEEINSIANANKLIEKLPQTCNVLGKVIDISPYIVRRLTSDILRIVLLNMTTNGSAIINSAPLVWTFFSHARALNVDQFEDEELVFRRGLFEYSLKSAMFAGSSISAQAQAFIGRGSLEPRDITDPSRFIVFISSQMIKFVDTEYDSHLYNHFAESFSSCNHNISYYRNIFRVLGIHPALYLDATLTNGIVENFYIVHQAFEFIRQNLKKPNDVFKHEMAKPASKALLSLSVGLALRNIIRRAISLVNEEAIPGISDIIATTELDDRPECNLLKEVFSQEDTTWFIKTRLLSRIKVHNDGLKDFFTFIATLIAGPFFDDIEFDPENNTLSHNVHLIPYAFQLIIELAPSLFTEASYNKLQGAIELFFTKISQIVESRMKKLKAQNLKARYILMDQFPKLCSKLEYGRMKHVFPYALLTHSYPETQ
ncbi:hypothetical protein TVAG_239370 [Trichomonas vaginalis G3]|uniref:CYRIA/CYRIB Rac1 binding domain-containing protein n=1 Tax=Trichomonas vaginalis (strain ATCC PRA-98 / G3) TaxID=412133 RepID=A2DGG7_TRIV3|nr:NCK-associateD protein 1 family [Trichomonas vaginalis G3]EAY20563.1 hypothetical protein TVAG_239370 [Trichomonas vaginalis G3]KAI5488242.1 NCK-associateD protein 1 family [Trichomonas vaginalis G3]|eukprot:XP_001581549.1 hypothetical protein [Trichomonas vaginalis G3]